MILKFENKVWLWTLYDFANSLAFANVSFYFGLWLVSEQGFSDVWISIPTALSTIILFFLLPSLGARSDRLNKHVPHIKLFSLFAIATLLGIGFLALKVNILNIFFTIALYFLFQIFFQSAVTLYDSLLHKLSRKKHDKEKISGLGLAAGQLGNAMALFIVLPFVSGRWNFFGITGRPVAFFLGAILFLLFSIPFLFFFKENKNGTVPTAGHTHRMGILKSLAAIKNHPGVLNYLIAYYLFSDALLTVQLFGSLYLDIVGKINDNLKTLISITGLLLAVVGALTSGHLVKLFKNTRQFIIVLISSWTISIAILAIATQPIFFIILSAINGLFFGAIYSLSRAYYSDLAPKNHQGEFFGLYTLFERFASVLGPLVWSLAVFSFSSFGPVVKYRFAMLCLAGLVFISLVVLHSGKEPDISSDQQNA